MRRARPGSGPEGRSRRGAYAGSTVNAPPAPTARRRRKGAAFAVLFGCLVALGGFVVLRGRASSPLPDDGSDPTVGAAGPAPAPLAGASRPGLSPPSPAPKDAPDTIETLPSEDRLTDEAFRALETDVEGGRIEGVVMSGTRPHGGGHARLWPDYMKRAFGDVGGEEPLATVTIAADGTFRLEGVAPGTTYAVEIAPEGGTTRLVLFPMPEPPATTRRVVVALESGGVAGRVFDRVGKPAVGAVVHVNSTGGSRGFVMNCEARAGADGTYEIGGLPPGPYWIVTHLGTDWWTARDDRTLTFQAKAREVVRLDLGSERGEPLWTGILKTTGGKPVRGPGELVLGAQPGSYDTTPFDAEGAFAKRLAPGTYRVDAVLPGFAVNLRVRIPIAVVIGDRDLAQDLVLPGARVSGVVKDLTSGRTPVGARNQAASITPEGKTHMSTRSVTLDADGSFVIDGVVPGRYVLSGWPAALRDASRGTITFEVREGIPEVVVEAWVQVD